MKIFVAGGTWLGKAARTDKRGTIDVGDAKKENFFEKLLFVPVVL